MQPDKDAIAGGSNNAGCMEAEIPAAGSQRRFGGESPDAEAICKVFSTKYAF